MIVIDRRDDPLFVIRIEGVVTLEDLYEYRRLCDDLTARQCSYATVWVEESAIPAPLHTQPDLSDHSLPHHVSQEPIARRFHIWAALLRMLSA